jgi:hypothetical protein
MFELPIQQLKTIFGLLAVALSIIGYAPYLIDTLKGRTTPHIYTWFIWGTLAAIGYSLQVSDNAGVGAWVMLSIAILGYTVFGLGLRNGTKNITWSDTLFFILALIALLLWLVAKQPVLSVILVSITDLLGFGPTMRKAWHHPFSETILTYRLNAVRQTLGLLALEHYSIVTWLYPLVLVLGNGLFSIVLSVRRRVVRRLHNQANANMAVGASAPDIHGLE